MNRLEEFRKKYLAKLNAYWVVVVLFVAFTFTVGDSNLYKRYTYDETIRSLEKEIKQYEEEIKLNRQKLQELRMDREGLERFAREEYLMRQDDEDLFIIK